MSSSVNPATCFNKALRSKYDRRETRRLVGLGKEEGDDDDTPRDVKPIVPS